MLDNEIPSDNFQRQFTRNEDFVRVKTNTKEPNQLSTFEKSKKVGLLLFIKGITFFKYAQVT